MFKWFIPIKIVLYSLSFIRAFQNTPPNFLLVAIVFFLLMSDFWRTFYKYSRQKVNIISLLVSLVLSILFAVFSNRGDFEKLYIIYLMEGTAILPNPLFIFFALLATTADIGYMVLFEFRVSGRLNSPEIAQLMLYAFVFILVFSERRQREQKLTFEKLAQELRYLNLQLKKSMSLNENLAMEAERRRIVGEIHDSLGHDLTGLILTLEAGKKLISHDVDAGKTHFDKAIRISRLALDSVRELVSAKKDLDFAFELIPRLQEMVRDVRALTGLQLNLDINVHNIELSGKEQFNLYRIFQEAVTNTLRHSNAGQAQISLSGNREALAFSYRDNGSGAKQIEEGNGLKGMRDRISLLGGTISFRSQPGLGFEIEGYIDRRDNWNG